MISFEEFLQSWTSSRIVLTNDTNAAYGFIADICTAISAGEIPRNYSKLTEEIAQALDNGVTGIEALAEILLRRIRPGDKSFLKYPSAGPTHHMS